MLYDDIILYILRTCPQVDPPKEGANLQIRAAFKSVLENSNAKACYRAYNSQKDEIKMKIYDSSLTTLILSP